MGDMEREYFPPFDPAIDVIAILQVHINTSQSMTEFGLSL